MRGLSLEQCLEWDLKQLINRLLQIPREKIERDKNLVEFGFNSISLTQFAILLIKHYGIEITPAMFFGYSTMEKLSQYYLTEHHEVIETFYREDGTEKPDLVKPEKPALARVEPSMRRRNGVRFAGRSQANFREPIAIIGMSGRFPEARNIDELWKILVEGRSASRKYR